MIESTANDYVQKINGAIEHLYNTLSIYKERCNSEWCNKDRKAFDTLRSIYEKQSPKKIIYAHPLQEDDAGDYMCSSCRCGTILDAYGNILPYCHYCGQRIEVEADEIH